MLVNAGLAAGPGPWAPPPRLAARLRNRLGRTRRRFTTAALREPSFSYKELEAQRERRLMRELGCKDPAFEVDAKDDMHAWAVRLGLPTPRLLASYDDVRFLDWGSLPDRFVLKPTRGTVSAGVYLLVRDGDGWRDLLSRRVLGESDIAQEIAELLKAETVSASFLVEELVEDPRLPGEQPVDYKVWTFFGRVGLIEAKFHGIDRQGRPAATWRNFDTSWTDLGNLFNEDYDDSIPAPLHGPELLDVARRVSAAIPRPFLRVDLLDSADGPVLGEITPEPGGDNSLPPRLDRLFGRYWEDAEARLKVRAARSGIMSPTDEPQSEAWVGQEDGLRVRHERRRRRRG